MLHEMYVFGNNQSVCFKKNIVYFLHVNFYLNQIVGRQNLFTAVKNFIITSLFLILEPTCWVVTVAFEAALVIGYHWLAFLNQVRVSPATKIIFCSKVAKFSGRYAQCSEMDILVLDFFFYFQLLGMVDFGVFKHIHQNQAGGDVCIQLRTIC